MKSRECDNFDKLVDLVVTDRLKDSLSGPCLKYCLSIEGNKVLSSAELAALADTFDANYASDGRYRGGTVLTFKEDGIKGNARSQGKQPQANPPITPTPGTGQAANTKATNPKVATGNNNNNNNPNRSGVRPPRKRWNCSFTAHLQSNCPERPRAGGNAGRQPARANVCFFLMLYLMMMKLH